MFVTHSICGGSVSLRLDRGVFQAPGNDRRLHRGTAALSAHGRNALFAPRLPSSSTGPGAPSGSSDEAARVSLALPGRRLVAIILSVWQVYASCGMSARSCCRARPTLFGYRGSDGACCCARLGRPRWRACPDLCSLSSIGIPHGSVSVANSRVLNLSLYPILIATQSIPKVAIAPIILVWFGLGHEIQARHRVSGRVLPDRGRYRYGPASDAARPFGARALAARVALADVLESAVSCRAAVRISQAPRWRSPWPSSAQ